MGCIPTVVIGDLTATHFLHQRRVAGVEALRHPSELAVTLRMLGCRKASTPAPNPSPIHNSARFWKSFFDDIHFFKLWTNLSSQCRANHRVATSKLFVQRSAIHA